jgi:putative addiction module killer protein
MDIVYNNLLRMLYKIYMVIYKEWIQKIENNEHFGECEPVGEGIREIKIDYAKGYRVYFKELDGKIIILLAGGDKSTQQKDIEKAKEILKRIKQ